MSLKKETSIILFQLGAVDILTFSPLNVTGRLGQTPRHSFRPRHRSKPLISLVPFNLRLHCFQG